MDENTTFDTIDEDVINCDAEVMEDESDDSEGCGLGAVAGLVGAGIAAGVAIHKWVAPAVGKAFRKVKNGIHQLTAEKKYIEVEKSEDKNESKDSEN